MSRNIVTIPVKIHSEVKVIINLTLIDYQFKRMWEYLYCCIEYCKRAFAAAIVIQFINIVRENSFLNKSLSNYLKRKLVN